MSTMNSHLGNGITYLYIVFHTHLFSLKDSILVAVNYLRMDKLMSNVMRGAHFNIIGIISDVYTKL